MDQPNIIIIDDGKVTVISALGLTREHYLVATSHNSASPGNTLEISSMMDQGSVFKVHLPKILRIGGSR